MLATCDPRKEGFVNDNIIGQRQSTFTSISDDGTKERERDKNTARELVVLHWRTTVTSSVLNHLEVLYMVIVSQSNLGRLLWRQ